MHNSRRILPILLVSALFLPALSYGFTTASKTTFSTLENVTSTKLNTAVGAWADWINNNLLNGGTSLTIASGDSALVPGTIVISGTIRMTGTVDLATRITPRVTRTYGAGLPTRLFAGIYTDTLAAEHAVLDTASITFPDTTGSGKWGRGNIQTSAIDSTKLLTGGSGSGFLTSFISKAITWTGAQTVFQHILTASDSTYQAWPYSVVVDSAGNGHVTTPGAQTVPYRTICVRKGTYSGAVTISGVGTKMVIEPGAIFSGAITLSGAHTTLVIGNGAKLNGGLTLSGNGAHVECENGVYIAGTTISADSCHLDGGGWSSISAGGLNDGIKNSGSYNLIENIAASCGAANRDAIGNGAATMGTYAIVKNCLVTSATGTGIRVGTDNNIEGNTIITAANDAFRINGVRAVVRGNKVLNTSVGISALTAGNTASHLVITNNSLKAYGAAGMIIDAGSDSSIIVSNRVDSLLTNNGTGNTTSPNVVFVIP